MNDSTFITNDQGNSLRDRFKTLIKGTQFFDVLVGYFYTSGFYALSQELETTEKIRILVGISTNRETYELAVSSHKQVADEFSNQVTMEMETSENNNEVEAGVKRFVDWINSGKLEIRAYADQKIHSKLYIMTFADSDRDAGRVITGSSNFTQSGLVDNLEFNVELKNFSDWQFAKEKFDSLWENSVELSNQFIETINTKTWLNDTITPYQLYLKFLYEYFKDEINQDTQLDIHYRPANFKELQYQNHAVLNAKRIVQEYGGVFLSDVVGLGKTFMGTMLCQELGGRTLVIAPPALIDEENPGSWSNAFRSFGFRANEYSCKSIGILDKIVKKGEHQGFDTVVIDESHRFRNEVTESYELLAQICSGKRVILVTATPYNNSPKDILSQIKLFQKGRSSTIPGIPDLENFFSTLQKRINSINKITDKDEYFATLKDNTRQIREKVLKYLMVRRTRSEITKYYSDDLKGKLSFPEVADPLPLYYELNELENKVFQETMELVTQKLKYARYTPMLYHSQVNSSEVNSQKNMAKFMKILLVKRLESSFYAFGKTIERFITSYQNFINQYNSGKVYVSAKYSQKIFEYLEAGELDQIDKLMIEGKAEQFESTEFSQDYIKDLEKDHKTLLNIKEQWDNIKRDPKLDKIKEYIQSKEALKEGKSIIFTESTETAQYLFDKLQEVLPGKVLKYSGGSSALEREVVISNFDASAKHPADDFDFLLTTDVLAEGVNLHRANVVLNYDIPWNPTRIMQRVGRINRVDTKHKIIHTFTFFPTEPANNEIQLRENAESKVAAFISLLGADAKLLTEDEVIEAHSIFSMLISKDTITGEQSEGPSELQYLTEIRGIRDNHPALFEKIKRLPKKARTTRNHLGEKQLVTYFRKGKMQKFYLAKDSSLGEINSTEIDFLTAAAIFLATNEEQKIGADSVYYEFLKSNQNALELSFNQPEEIGNNRGGNDYSARVAKIIKSKEFKNFQGFTDQDEQYIDSILKLLDEGALPKKTSNKVYTELTKNIDIIQNPLKVISILRLNISNDYFQVGSAGNSSSNTGKQEIVLSEMFINAKTI
jgi:superfamily II DNA or RNA helicase